MKTAIIAIVTLCCATQVKAQQAPVLPKQQPLQNFKALPDSLKRNDLSNKLVDSLMNKAKANVAIRQNVIANANMDNMPVAKPQGNFKTPVVQTDRTGYNMPVAGMSKPRVYIMNKPKEEKPVVPAANSDVK